MRFGFYGRGWYVGLGWFSMLVLSPFLVLFGVLAVTYWVFAALVTLAVAVNKGVVCVVRRWREKSRSKGD